MSGIWVSVGAWRREDGLSRVLHRGQFKTDEQLFESPSGPVRFQQCRESPVDRSLSFSPRSGPRYSIAFDGCLYNREELSRLAQTPLDTEVTDAQLLLAAFDRL